jgi:hypothetical protein
MADLPPIEGSMAASEDPDTFSGSGTTMITADRYYTLVVKPTVEDFKKDNRDLRLALLASMVSLHTVDYVMQNRAGGDPDRGDDLVRKFNNDNANHFHFSVVRGFALASKHCQLKKSLSGFHSGKHRSVAAGRAGEMEAGVTPNEPGGIQVLWNGEGVYLSVALDGALALFESAFPEIGSGGTSS